MGSGGKSAYCVREQLHHVSKQVSERHRNSTYPWVLMKLCAFVEVLTRRAAGILAVGSVVIVFKFGVHGR